MFLVAPLLLAWCWPSTHKHLAPRQKRRLRRPRSRPRQRPRSRRPPVTTAPPASVSPALSATPSAANQFADKIKERVDRKFKHKGFAITVDGNDGEEPDSHRHHGDDDIPGKVLPIAIISVLAVFGFPVAIVAVIMFSSWARTRSLHRTVRMMVEKGQPVPPELLSSPAAAPVIVRPW